MGHTRKFKTVCLSHGGEIIMDLLQELEDRIEDCSGDFWAGLMAITKENNLTSEEVRELTKQYDER